MSMKTRIDFVTNSSTANYLVITGSVGKEKFVPKLRTRLLGFLKSCALKPYYHNGSIEDVVMVDVLPDKIEYKIYLDIPFHMVINDINGFLETWMGKHGFKVSDTSMYIHAEYDG